ncbi:MAG: hypothetical protein ACYDAP_10340, partial [Thermoplasmataceae archaeon]
NANWPGYPMSNVGIQSTKSAAPLAASWAVMNFLGINGYVNLAGKTLEAKDRLVKGLVELGYDIVGSAETTIFAFTSKRVNLFRVAAELKAKGWFLQVQPGSEREDLPSSLHMNVSPIHVRIADEFLKDLKSITQKLQSESDPDTSKDSILALIQSIRDEKTGIIEMLNGQSSPVKNNQEILYEIIRHISPEVVEKAFKDMVNDDFSPSDDFQS